MKNVVVKLRDNDGTALQYRVANMWCGSDKNERSLIVLELDSKYENTNDKWTYMNLAMRYSGQYCYDDKTGTVSFVIDEERVLEVKTYYDAQV